MRNRSLLLLVLLGTVLLVVASAAQRRQCDHQLPEQLRELAKQTGCGPVPGFYDRPGMIEPPYLYGYLPGDKEENAVFWCYREQEAKPYLLVFVEGLGQGRKGRVASTIPWEAEPGGLSLFDWPNINLYGKEDEEPYDPQHLPLDAFVSVDNPKERGPKGETTKYAPLQESYDGLATLFYREGDRWLYLVLH